MEVSKGRSIRIATGYRTGRLNRYSDWLRAGRLNIYSDWLRAGRPNMYSDWLRAGRINRYSDWFRAGRQQMGFRVLLSTRYFSSPRHSSRFWGLLIHLFNYTENFSRVKSAGTWRLPPPEKKNTWIYIIWYAKYSIQWLKTLRGCYVLRIYAKNLSRENLHLNRADSSYTKRNIVK
jgi:hypothetical protein